MPQPAAQPATTLAQVRSQRLEVSNRLLELTRDDEPTAEDDAEFGRLTARMESLNRRERALIEAGDDEPAEVVASGAADDEPDADAEFARLVAAASAADVLDAALFDRRTTGATAELQAELHLGANVVPLEIFAAATATSAGDQQTQEPTIPQIFASPISAGLGIDRRTVGVGTAAVPVVTAPTAGPAEAAAAGATVADSQVTIAGVVLSPSRLQVSASIDRTELATFRGLESEVEMVLRDAIMSALDRQALYAPAGIMNSGTAPTATTTVADYAAFLGAVYGALDGRYAAGLMDLTTLVGAETARLAARTYRGSTADNETAYDALMARTGGLMASAHVAAPSNDDQEAVTYRAPAGMMPTGCAQRIWGGAEVIRDPYTLSADGQVRCTVVLMQATSVLRAGQYVRHSFHLA